MSGAEALDHVGVAAADLTVVAEAFERLGFHLTPLARHAGETIAAGGKRLRPLLVFLAAGVPAPETEGLVQTAVAAGLGVTAILGVALLKWRHPPSEIALLILLGFVLLVELASFTTIGAAQGKKFAIGGHVIDTTAPLPWLVALAALGLGALWMRHAARGFRERWDALIEDAKRQGVMS